MKILISGASGFLGSHLLAHYNRMASDSMELHAISNSSEPIPYQNVHYHKTDLTNLQKTTILLEEIQPTVIINCAAITNTAFCESHHENAFHGNVGILKNLADSALSLSKVPYFLHLSTDMVFDGFGHIIYDEESSMNPINYYGKLKAQCDVYLLQNHDLQSSIIRPSLIYGHSIGMKECFLDWMTNTMKAGNPVLELFTDEYRCPVHVNDLIYAIVTTVNQKANGLFHIVGKDRISRFEMGEIIAGVYGYRHDCFRGVKRSTSTAMNRPGDLTLSYAKAQKILNYKPISFLEGIKEVHKMQLLHRTPLC